MIDIEIDGKSLTVEPGSMIIEVADKAGIPIPRFCYHKKLSIAANCRMCLVDVEKSPKPLPACATPVTAGMKVSTCSARAREAQKAVMEFLLINHPLDCPICDQGGECELQDLSLGYGKDVSRFNVGKRSVKDDDLGPLIATEMTRCIQCTRCVRFGQEVAGIRELGATGRGENMQIGTYIKHSLTSEMSGNIIDLCPVGALTSKPYRFTARPWELKQIPAIAPHDCMGSHIYIHLRQQELMRVVPRENEAINETWLSDRDRFSYLGLQSEDRLLKPLIKVNGAWQEAEWEQAFAMVVKGISNVIAQYGARQIGALASPSSTTEEFYLLQKLIRGLGSQTIDHRLHQTDFTDQKQAPLYPSLGIPIAELEEQDLIMVIGARCGTAPANQAPALLAPSVKQPKLAPLKLAINCANARITLASGWFCAMAPIKTIVFCLPLIALAKSCSCVLGWTSLNNSPNDCGSSLFNCPANALAIPANTAAKSFG